MYDDIIKEWNAQADEFNYWEALGEEEKIEFAFNCALAMAAGRLSMLATTDNSIRHAIHIINICKCSA